MLKPLTSTHSRWVAVGLLLLLFAQLATSAVVKSPTFDEPIHATRSYVALVTGDWRMQAGHPPLVHRLVGPWFWLLPNHPDLRTLPGWNPHIHTRLAREVFDAFDLHPDVLIFGPRVVVMGLALLLGTILYRWSTERHGSLGGVLALFVYTFSPNILAHGRLITTDFALVCFFLLAVYAFQRLLMRPTTGRFVAASVAMGLALGSKVSAVLLVPIFALLASLRSSGWGRDASKHSRGFNGWIHRLARHAGWLVLTGLAALLLVWILYGFEIGAWAAHWPALPLPTYVTALLRVQEHGGARGHPAYLMGQRSGEGWGRYFPIALVLKTPLPVLLGAFAGMVWLLWQKRWWALLTGALPPAFFFAVAILSSLSIGYRHILPVVPFLALLIAALAEPLRRYTIAAIVGGGMALWLIVGTLGIYPDYLAYFNELAGGPDGGRYYLTDSNLDWGQDLIQLRDHLQDQGIEEVYLSYFGNVDPAVYGLRYTPLPSHFSIGEVEGFTPFSPPPGFYAISVTNLSGQYFIENPNVLDWFNHQTPVARVGHSINVYHVSPDASSPTWVGICHAPGAPLNDETFARKVGCATLRSIHFDCRNSWVFAKGDGPAWFVVPTTDRTEGITPPFGLWQTIFEQENYDGKQLFTVYRWDAQDALATHLDTLQVDTSVTPELPVRVGEHLALLGYEVDNDVATVGAEVRLTTYWKVLARPDRPLSLMAHLVNQDGHTMSVGDALGAPSEVWAQGDTVVQTHRLPLDLAMPQGIYRLQTGAYWLSDLNHLPAFDKTGNHLTDDVVPLIKIEVEAAS